MKTIYRPDGIQYGESNGARKNLRALAAELRATWSLAWRLFTRDVSAKYRQSLLGVVWALITPLFMVAILFALSRSGILQVGEGAGIPYVAFALIGITVWGVFATGLSQATESLVGAGKVILKVNFPKGALVLSATMMGLFELLVRMPVVLAICIYLGVAIDALSFFLAAGTLLPLFTLALGCGLILSVVAVIFRDIVYLMPILLTLLMIISPVLYPIPPESMLGQLNRANPLAYLVNTTRGMLIGDYAVSLGFWISCVASVLLLVVASRLFLVAQRRVVERV